MAIDNCESVFVELDRTFHELSINSESDTSDLHALLSSNKRLGWMELLQEYRVIVLSEGGSGKTTEIRNMARRLRRENRAAFFIRLEHVATEFEISFEEGSYEDFQRWLNSGEEGWLLLDSVDEARLRDPIDFEAAIRKLGRVLTSVRQRTHIVITRRSSAWRPKTDLALCMKHLPFARPAVVVSGEPSLRQNELGRGIEDTVRKDEEVAFKIVALDDLGPKQIEIFANAKGLSKVKQLLDAVERADAWSFTSRPQDLEEVLDYWNTYDRIGSRLELMRNSIDRRLSESDQRRAEARPLSGEKVRRGAKLVAGASTLAHEPTIGVPDGAANARGLSIKSLLNDWNEVECVTLLSRPIFDEAIYGTVRFHKRSVREYLTAEWCADLLKRETSRRSIEALFFREQYGLEVVVPVMRPILPWLVIFDEKIRQRVCRVAPEVFFEGGDPSQLPREIRQQILRQVCDQLASGKSTRSMADYSAAQRFANADLTQDIKELLRTHASNDDILWFLLQMVWQGELVDALPDAKCIALSPTSEHYSRTAAFRVVAALGSIEDNADLRRSFLNEAALLDRNLLAELIKADLPSANVIDWLFKCLAKLEDQEPHRIDALTEQLSALVERVDAELLPSMLDQAIALLNESPLVERRHCEVSTRYIWLLKPMAIAVERLVKNRSAGALGASSLGILHKLPISLQYEATQLSGIKLEFGALVPEWPDLNANLFWYLVRHERKWLDHKKGERLIDWWQVPIFGSYVRFGTQDFDRVLSEVATRSYLDDRLVALSLAFRLYIDAGRPLTQRGMLKKIVRGEPALSDRLSELMRPPRQSAEARKYKKMDARWKRQSELRNRKEKLRRDQWRNFVIENVDRLRDPKLDAPDNLSRAQWYLYERMREVRGDSSGRSEGNWQSIKQEFGETVARAFRDGAVSYWRRHTPKLISEGAPGSSTTYSTIFGLTGLAIEAREVDDWPDTLNDIDVELAFRYAMHELNGFPPWLPRLFAKFPETIRRMSLQEIAYELATETEDKESHYLLYDVSWGGDWLWDTVAPSLYASVSVEEPKNLKNLQYVLNIIQASSLPDSNIARLASAKVGSLTLLDHVAYWFAIWTSIEPGDAIPALELRLASISSDEDRAKFAMLFVTRLLGNRRYGSSGVREAFKTPNHLKSLYLLMHRHIRRAEDIERAGEGVYSPGLRDNAQDARNQLSELLRNIPGKEAFLAIEEIARVHPDERSRQWFGFQVKKKAEQDAENPPWPTTAVREFYDDQERVPCNHRDLFDLAVKRLLDLKDDLEKGDSSDASILRVIPDEIEIRKYIGGWCRRSALGRYSIPQEEELADAKRIDLRWHAIGFDAPVPVELKLADNWTGPSLFERLEVQLCGDYLRDRRSVRGIFLLVYRGQKKAWELPDHIRTVSFEELINELQGHWSAISANYPNIDEICVIGIDLTMRSH